ncbi:MAG: hypothetical protein JNM17_05800 [Archangium sp.]|nr:hypothetical protein [Archangium sp.]
MGLFSGIKKAIGGALKTVGNFAKKAVSFGAKLINNPIIGTALKLFPLTAPFANAASLILNVADGALNKGGLKGILGGLMQGLPGGAGGLLSKAGSLLSGAGLSTIGNLLGKAGGSSMISDIVGGLITPERAQQKTPVAQAEMFNLQQLSAFRFAELLKGAQ